MKTKKVTDIQSQLSETELSIIESKPDKDVIKEFVFALDDFSEKADIKNPNAHRSYVYALCEKTEEGLVPFYIGEGKGTRVWSHEFETADQIKLLEEELTEENRLDELEERKQRLKEKIKRIDEIKNRNGKIVKYIIKWGMTSKEAFMAESALINLLQIGGLNFDSNSNAILTNIVKGHQSEAEKQTGTTAARTVEDFCEEFAKEPLFFEELQKENVKALLININSGYPECLKFDKGKGREKAIRDTVCGNWSLADPNYLDKLGIEYVFATVRARIVGIYRIKEVGGKKFHNMYECVGDNSEYPRGEDTVPFRNGDYEDAKIVVEVANRKGKKPSQLVLSDMPSAFRERFIKEKDPAAAFQKCLNRKYMILEDVPASDPNKSLFNDYMYRRIIHTQEWVKKRKLEKQKERDKAIADGKTKNLPDPEKTTDNIFGSGNPIRYIER
ncbi:MAG: GIY-YIG nuclease family protein [Clostridiales bacterium]|nr:GIY-YIG nuclease family protein [Clostridiales bacterium]